jgi:Cu(I)/Ag(I) efflux system membrane fusion protein
VNEAANDVSSTIKAVDMGLLKGDPHMTWMEQLEILEKSITSIGNLSDIEKQRNEFAHFNLTFYNSLKTFGLSNVTTYYQFCPMALDNTGAYWFSDSEKIQNPYFGDMMLECGEVIETIK